MNLGTAKHELLEHFARVGRAVSSAARLELLDHLAQGEKSVETLARGAGLTVKNTSAHLKALRSAGLVASRKEGAFVIYRLADPTVHEFIASLQDLARRRVAEVERLVRDYYESPDELEPLQAHDLLARLGADDVTLVDVRPADEFRSGHIPGAVSIPVGELERRLSELPPGKEVVAYCRGRYCILAVRALEILHARGVRARRLEAGVPDWARLGFEVTRAEGA